MGRTRGRRTYDAWIRGTYRGGVVWLAVILISVAALPVRANVTVDTGAPPVTAQPLVAPGGPGLGVVGPPTGLTFSYTKGAGIVALENGNPAEQALAADVVAGFEEAGDLWSVWFTDPITINVTIDYDELDPNILGSTHNNSEQSDFAPTKAALINDAVTDDDATATANLQPGGAAGLDMITNDTSVTPSPRIRDNDDSANNVALDVPRGNLKALGLLAGDDPAEDGAITFSSSFTWDFERSNGITGGAYDFVGVAAHEIGHLMGFTSGVDTVDYAGSDEPETPLDLDDYRVFSVLDLYRYSSDSLDEDDQPATGAVLDLAFGDTPFFSIDGGATNLAKFATGFFNGDGRQASHWKDNLSLGILDPTVAPGELMVISLLDLQAFDVIGYDPVPEPATLIVMAAGALAVMRRRRRLR